MAGLQRVQRLLFFILSSYVIIQEITCTVVIDQLFTGVRGYQLKLNAESMNHQLHSSDRILCAVRCMQLSECRTMSWNQQTRECLLSSFDVTNGDDANDLLEADEEWNTMSLMEYTVFGVAQRDGEFTYDEAVARCIDESTVIAGPDDLLYSHSLGFSYPKCCWLSDGSIGYVVQGIDNIITCDTSSSPQVICLLN